MTEFPPPAIDTPAAAGWTPLPAERWHPSKRMVLVGLFVVLLIVGKVFGSSKSGTGNDDTSDIDGQVSRWNALTATQQADLCESVHLSGGTAVALRLGWPGKVDDVAWFLNTQAC